MVGERFIYRDTAIGGVEKRNNILTQEQVIEKLKSCRMECYYTWFLFPEELKRHVAEKKSVSGYTGEVEAPYLPFDIDAQEHNLNKALQEARKLVTELMFEWGVEFEWMMYYFSGKKGFHILIPAGIFQPSPSNVLPLALREMVKEITKIAGVKVDLQIYDAMRLFRIPNTIHKDTNLYKIPLAWEEFKTWDVDTILEAARRPRRIQWPEVKGESSKLMDLYIKCFEKVERKVPLERIELPREKAEVPSDRKLCYYRILEGVSEGERDECAIRLACHFRQEGFSSDLVAGLLLSWNQKNKPPLEQEVIERKVLQAFSQPYSYGCSDSILSKFCSERCYLRKKVKMDLKLLPDWGKDYVKYVDSLKSRLIHFGLGEIDKAMRGVAPGEVAEVIALPSVGKSALALNILRHVSVNQFIPSIFFSLEQPGAQVFERAASLSVEEDGYWLEQSLLENTLSISDLSEAVRREFSEVFLCDTSGISLRDILELTQVTEQKWERKIGFLVIDYLGLIGGAYGTSYEVISRISKDIKTMAKNLDTAILFLHHVSVKQKELGEPVSLKDARDSSVAVDAVDFLIGMWRPKSDLIEISLLKNRKGPTGIREKFKFSLKDLSIETF